MDVSLTNIPVATLRMKDANPAWAKSENCRIVREMNSKDLENTDLGKFVESLREFGKSN